VSSEAITAIFTGLTGLIAALAVLMANRNRRISLEQRSLRRRVRDLERQVLALTEHTFTLELSVARAGGKVPGRPPILEQLNADDDDEDSGPAPPTPGRHALG
jgi:hypothetical protein